MDTPGKKKWDPPKNRESQRRYQEEKNAAMDGIEQVRARNCQRYYDRIDRLKATGQYEAFKKKKLLGRTAALSHHAGGATK